MASLATYDPSKVYIIIGGVPLSGYADGTFVTIDEMSDGVMSQAGADGEVARSMSTDRRVEVTITLQQTSLSNAILSGLYIADKISGAGIIPILVEDLTGGTEFAAGQAWINKQASRGYSKGIETREWKMTAVVATFAALGLGGV